ncbi:MAG: hypothetical protein L0213_09015, partial [Candidatus Dadabacteria bacterium]|nr:hypothetical protein [Candidatus Dadabacteria bacterium]
MSRNLYKALQSSFFVLVLYSVSCATITVNVYFPAEEVREAYSNLEEEFLKQGENGGSGPEKKQPDANKPAATPPPQSMRNYPARPALSSVKKYLV